METSYRGYKLQIRVYPQGTILTSVRRNERLGGHLQFGTTGKPRLEALLLRIFGDKDSLKKIVNSGGCSYKRWRS